MNTKEYELIVRAICTSTILTHDDKSQNQMIDNFADVLRKSYPKFDKDKFEKDSMKIKR